MRKATIILLLVVQIALLFIFQNVYMLLKGYEEVGVTNIPQLLENLGKMKGMFSTLSIVFGLFVIGTGVYLVVLFSRKKQVKEYRNIPPLQDYLLQLKTSETQLKEVVETQQESVIKKDELNKSIINNINAGIIFLNPKGQIEIFNRAAQELFSQSYGNAINNVPAVIFANFPGLLELLEKSSQEEALSQELESSGRVFLVHLNPIEKIGLLIFVRDITEARRHEEMDRRNSNFMMLGEMTAFLAHEVRNSLGVIYGYTKTIKTEEEKIGKVNKEIVFLTEMMAGFLNFSKPVNVKGSETIDLAEELERIAGEQGVEVEVSGDSSALASDPTSIHSVFSNLVLNSKEAGANKVTVEIEKGDAVTITLVDNGEGIEKKNRDKIWYPFFTTKDKGTGMGLASIRKIVNTLGGEITLELSEPGKTIFKIVFYNS
ncbi:MAG: PAS domain-containing protein [bacterium]|nr:PAS domain-containing protein [bacterium]